MPETPELTADERAVMRSIHAATGTCQFVTVLVYLNPPPKGWRGLRLWGLRGPWHDRNDELIGVANNLASRGLLKVVRQERFPLLTVYRITDRGWQAMWSQNGTYAPPEAVAQLFGHIAGIPITVVAPPEPPKTPAPWKRAFALALGVRLRPAAEPAGQCWPVTVEVNGEQVTTRVRAEQSMSDEAHEAFAQLVEATKRRMEAGLPRTGLCERCGFPVGTVAHRRACVAGT